MSVVLKGYRSDCQP